MCTESHLVFLESKDLEIFEIHFVDRLEFIRELIRRAVNVCIVHLHGSHPHQPHELSRLLVAIAGAVFGQSQGQFAIAAGRGGENLVVMRAVHGLEVVTLLDLRLPTLCGIFGQLHGREHAFRIIG